MHRINQDLLVFNKKIVDEICALLDADILCIAEDMSYNGRPMISKESYDEFLLPYYKELVPYAKTKRKTVFIDTDGNVDPMIRFHGILKPVLKV